MKLGARLESILFAAGDPVSLTELSQVTGTSKSEIRSALEELAGESKDRGLRVVYDKEFVQLVTAPEAADDVARYRQSELRGTLSQAGLETLAIVAYRGPVTRPTIEAVRGVQSSAPLRTLSVRGLIRETGRADEVGRPILYETTLELLKHLGITSHAELPPLSKDQEQKLRSVEGTG